MSSQQKTPFQPLSSFFGFRMRRTGNPSDVSRVHEEGSLGLKDIQSHTGTFGERSFDKSASTEYHADAFLDPDRNKGGLIQGDLDLGAQERCIYVRSTIDVRSP